ncbi:sulfatase-like hydrolase/transferase [Paenibacillus sp. J5C_2022]|uniref:sulfatase-like hydrolase/transferase n=1 Tax=Paenibacillus sp. J5C2022 TaxID=2977129 RepID=UPI0021D1353E|nr:sulfatase-like hydrolase/transferase [Paenibacillus sp. J5C2022]MCU6709127.1 sulfatase-like hydrolase/transferase [Paenibacillus sp. J5C2022]
MTQPNILLIVSDQLRYDCIGFSGRYPVRTPNLDRLADEGVWFSNAYTHIPLCCPARQSLLNGRRPETFGSLWNYDLGPPTPALGPDMYAWPRELNRIGYATGYLGKWHVHPTFDPTSYGYDDYVSLQDYQQFRQANYGPPAYNNGFFGETDPVPIDDARTHWMADQAISLIERYECEHSGPWHVRLDFDEPHLPCRPSEPFASWYKPDEVPRWDSFNERFENKPYIQKQQLLNWQVEHYEWSDWSPTVARYYAAISQMDDAVGKIIDFLKRSNLSERTIVIFTADHGDMCGAHRMMDKHCIMYEDIMRVPLIISGPGMPHGQIRQELVYNLLDLPPTLSALAGFEPGKFQGRSLKPLLDPLYDVLAQEWRKEIVSTYNGQQFGLFIQRMITDGCMKLVWNPTDVDELYDLQSDPAELNNLIHDADWTDQIRALRKRLYEILLQEGDSVVANPWIKQQLLQGRKL